MKKQMEILLGTTKNNGLVFGEFRIKNDNTFSMSFSEVVPETIDLNDNDILVERMEDFIECHDAQSILNLLEEYDCSPRELPNKMLNYYSTNDIIDTFFDNSLYTETFEKDDVTLLFNFSSTGQYDCREDINDLFVSKELFDTLLNTWDKFHLKEITPEALQKLEAFLVEVENQDIDKIVEKWVNENEDDLF